MNMFTRRTPMQIACLAVVLMPMVLFVYVSMNTKPPKQIYAIYAGNYTVTEPTGKATLAENGDVLIPSDNGSVITVHVQTNDLHVDDNQIIEVNYSVVRTIATKARGKADCYTNNKSIENPGTLQLGPYSDRTTILLECNFDQYETQIDISIEVWPDSTIAIVNTQIAATPTP